MIMEKEFVNYNQALKLKELGFNEPCLASWSYTYELQNYVELNLGYIIDGSKNYTNAPTFSQAFRWFRKNHGLSAIVSQFGYSIENGFGGIEYYIDEDENPICYEEAELACLEKLIELTFKSE